MALVRTPDVHRADSEASARTARRRVWRAFSANPLTLVGAFLALAFVLVAVFAPELAPHNPFQPLPNGLTAIGAPQPPDFRWTGHFFGTDIIGRDMLSRMIYATRVSLQVGVFSTLIAGAIGALVGLISGYFGGFLDNVLMRVTEVVIAFPFLLFIILVVSVLHPQGQESVVVMYTVIGLFGWTTLARVTRGLAMSVGRQDFVEAGRALGASDARLIFRHVLPQVLGTVVVYSSITIANNILLEATLGYLGVGAAPPIPSWGKMVAEGLDNGGFNVAPWLILYPGLMIMLAALSFNLIGEGLNDALNPRK